MELSSLIDSTNFEHSRTVSQISHLMAGKAGFSESECQVIEQAALCNDVGKAAIPADILGKPSSLTPEEYEADVFDALYSRRSDKEPWDVGRIKGYITQQAGRQFDESAVSLLFSILSDVLLLYENQRAERRRSQ